MRTPDATKAALERLGQSVRVIHPTLELVCDKGRALLDQLLPQ